jgi:type I restriction enzyme S subunit
MVLYKKQLEELDALAESVFYDVFGDPVTNEKGWKLVKLGSLGEWASGGTPSRANNSFFQGNIPWVTSGELNSIYIKNSIEHINEEAIVKSNAKLIKPGSLLFCKLPLFRTACN